MDNFSQEENEKEFEQDFVAPNMMKPEGEDIEFDENIDINEIQKILQQHMDEEEKNSTQDAEEDEEDEEEEFVIPADSLIDNDEDIIDETVSGAEAPFFPQDMQTAPMEIDPKAKKYVIYVDPENIEFIEKLSINERKLVINKILKEQEETLAKQKRAEELNKFLRHAIVAAITVIIGFPVLYAMVNKSLELTLSNYQQSQRNFGALYREQGKIKQQSMR